MNPIMGDSNTQKDYYGSSSIDEEFEYVLVVSGNAPRAENNLFLDVVMLSSGEAEFINEQMRTFNSREVYLKLECGDSK